MAEQSTKVKKKQWYPIVAPKLFDYTLIGETLVFEPSQMIGKTLNYSLMNLTNDPKRQNVTIFFKVIGVEGDNGKTNIIGYQIVPSSLKRFVRRNSEKIDLSFTCETSDNLTVRVKPLLISRWDVKGSVSAKLKSSVINYLLKTIKKMTYEEVINDLISKKIQDGMRATLNKVYPLKICEIRYFGIETSKKKEEVVLQVAESK